MDRFRSIYELWRKIKAFGQILDRREAYTCLILFIVGIASFVTGRLSFIEPNKPNIAISLCDLGPKAQASAIEAKSASNALNKPEVIPVSNAQKGQYIGSKTSNKYHLPECSGAKRIAEANKIWFQSREEAEKAGYSPAGNCPGI